MRPRRTGWAAAVLLAAAGLAPAQTPTEAPGGRVVAVVNGEPILQNELASALGDDPPGILPLTAAQRRQRLVDALTPLIDERLRRQYFQKHGADIPAAAVDAKYAELEAAQKAKNQTMADFCRENRQTDAQVRASLRELLQLEAYLKAKADAADLEKYFTANKDYFEKVTVRASHIVLQVPPDAPAEERAAAEARLKELREQIAAGKVAFADAAREHSQCPTATKGGDLGYFTRKWMPLDEAIVAAAYGLKPGELSGVVAGDYGLHLIQVTDRSPATATTYEAAREEVRDCFVAECRLELQQKLRKEAKVEITLP
jgi:peptidyl-prolyl cis-trans isomerase C